MVVILLQLLCTLLLFIVLASKEEEKGMQVCCNILYPPRQVGFGELRPLHIVGLKVCLFV